MKRDDPLLVEKLTWHLTPVVKWDELDQTFPILTPLDPNHWMNNDNTWIIIGLAVVVLVLLALCVILCRKRFCAKKIQQRFVLRQGNQSKDTASDQTRLGLFGIQC